jgi:hypothetical protein
MWSRGDGIPRFGARHNQWQGIGKQGHLLEGGKGDVVPLDECTLLHLAFIGYSDQLTSYIVITRRLLPIGYSWNMC